MKARVPFAYCRCVFAMPAPVPAVGRVALFSTAGHVTVTRFPGSGSRGHAHFTIGACRDFAGSLGPCGARGGDAVLKQPGH